MDYMGNRYRTGGGGGDRGGVKKIKDQMDDILENRDQLYKIGLPGKSILGDYFQENMTSPRPLFILRISFQGRPILIQLLPGGGQLHLHLRAVSRGDGHAVEEDAAGLEVQLAEDVQVAPPARLPPQERQREGRHVGQGTRLRPQDARELLIRRRKW